MKLKLNIEITSKNFRLIENRTWDYIVTKQQWIKTVPVYAAIDGTVYHPDLTEDDIIPLQEHLKLALMNERTM